MKFKTCIPKALPLPSLKWESFIPLLGKAHATIARYDEIVSSVDNPSAVFAVLTAQEALSSLETQKNPVSLEELLFFQASHEREDIPDDIKKMLDYREALLSASKSIIKGSFSFSLLRNIHRTIKKNAKEIGAFRQRQNWIGPEGCSIEEAYFYPPDVKILDKCMHNLKKYFHYKEKDPLVQLALFFAQLLIIHPFMDGNGRVARTLIPLFLYKKKLTSSPLFYLSTYFKKNHRLKYFEKLFDITAENKWEEWIQFFLKGIIEEGESSINKAKKTLSFYYRFNQAMGDSETAREVIDSLFASPVLDRENWAHKKEALKELKRFEQGKWIAPYRGQSIVIVKELI